MAVSKLTDNLLEEFQEMKAKRDATVSAQERQLCQARLDYIVAELQREAALQRRLLSSRG